MVLRCERQGISLRWLMHLIWGVGTSEMAGAGLGLEGRVVPVMVALPDPGLLLLKQDAAIVPAKPQ